MSVKNILIVVFFVLFATTFAISLASANEGNCSIQDEGLNTDTGDCEEPESSAPPAEVDQEATSCDTPELIESSCDAEAIIEDVPACDSEPTTEEPAEEAEETVIEPVVDEPTAEDPVVEESPAEPCDSETVEEVITESEVAESCDTEESAPEESASCEDVVESCDAEEEVVAPCNSVEETEAATPCDAVVEAPAPCGGEEVSCGSEEIIASEPSPCEVDTSTYDAVEEVSTCDLVATETGSEEDVSCGSEEVSTCNLVEVSTCGEELVTSSCGGEDVSICEDEPVATSPCEIEAEVSTCDLVEEPACGEVKSDCNACEVIVSGCDTEETCEEVVVEEDIVDEAEVVVEEEEVEVNADESVDTKKVETDEEITADTLTIIKTPLGAGTPPATQMLSGGGNSIDYTAVPASNTDPTLVQFIDLSKGTETYIRWDFGDGTSLSGTEITPELRNPVHKFPKPGYYISGLTIRCAGYDGQLWVHKTVIIKAGDYAGSAEVVEEEIEEIPVEEEIEEIPVEEEEEDAEESIVTSAGADTSTIKLCSNNVCTVGGNGQVLSLVNHGNAANPTMAELLAFLKADKTDEGSYSSTYVCSDFAKTLHDNAEAAGIRAGWVGANGANHAFNIFQTIDNGTVYIDCTGVPGGATLQDKQLNVKVGEPITGEYLFRAGSFDNMGTAESLLVYW